MAETENKAELSLLEEFFQDAPGYWRRLPDKPLFFGLLVAWLILFQFLGNSTFGYVDTASLPLWMLNAYRANSNEELHGVFIPFVVLALFWWKRDELLATQKRVWWPSLLLLALALFLHVIGYVVQQPRISIVAFFGGIYSLMGLAWGRAWLKASFFPFFLLAFCIPIGSLAESISHPLRIMAAKLAVTISAGGLGINVIREGALIFDAKHTFQFDVAPACSGLRSLISLTALTTIYGFVIFKTWWKKLLMLFVAVPLAIFGNVVRITGVIVVAEAFGEKQATAIEQNLGFVTYGIAFVCVFALGHWLREKPVNGQPEVKAS